MGLFDVLGMVLNGTQKSKNSSNPTQAHSSKKDAPVAFIDRIECAVNGSRMSINIHVKNLSQVQLHIDKIRILDTVSEIDENIAPGYSQELQKVYSGELTTDRPSSTCELDYCDQSGDYFRTRHMVETAKDENGRFLVRRIRYTPPVQDIFG